MQIVGCDFHPGHQQVAFVDRRDAGRILRLLVEHRSLRIWVPNQGQRDQRQLLVHRHRLVQMRSRIKNELQHLMLNQGVQKKRQLWNMGGRAALENLTLQGWTGRRREDLLGLLAMLETRVAELDEAVSQAAYGDSQAQLLMSQPGVGPITALAFVVTIGEVSRFQRGKQVASYLPPQQAKILSSFITCFTPCYQDILYRLDMAIWEGRVSWRPKGVPSDMGTHLCGGRCRWC
jgi:hypothetical protein